MTAPEAARTRADCKRMEKIGGVARSAENILLSILDMGGKTSAALRGCHDLISWEDGAQKLCDGILRKQSGLEAMPYGAGDAG